MYLRRGILLFSTGFLLFFGAFHAAQAASLYFSPNTKEVQVGNIVSITVLVNTQGQAANNAEASVLFPTDLLEVVSVSKSSSIFSLWVEEPTFSNQNGSLSFNGGIPTPGYNGTGGTIMSMTFRAKREGQATLYFSSASVLANDGLGTNILQSQGQAQLTLINAKTTPNPNPTPTPEQPVEPGKLPAVPISSPTHPNPEAWYSNPNPAFTWQVAKGVSAVRLVYDKNPYSQPTILYTPAVSEKNLANVPDGVFYMHMQQKQGSLWTTASHFRFQIDTVKPELFSLTEISRQDQTDPQVKFGLSASDSLSGMSHYLVQVDGGQEQTVPFTANSQYTALDLAPGKHSLVARAYDKAGNFTTTSADFEIQTLEAPVITKYPETLETNATLVIKGTAVPEATVTVWIKKEKEEGFSQSVQSNGKGDFVLITDQDLKAGVYKIWARAKDKRNAISANSDEVVIVVKKSPIAEAGTWMVSLLAVFIPLLALLLLLALILWYSWHKLRQLKKKLRKDTKGFESAMHQVFFMLKQNMEKQLKLLEKARSKRELTAEEEKVAKQLKADMESMEEFLSEEIQVIEDEIK